MRILVSVITSNNPSRFVQVMYNGEFDEYVCELHSGGKHIEAADYFAGDREDAFGTAQKMAEFKTAVETAAQMRVDRAVADAAAAAILATPAQQAEVEAAADAAIAKFQTEFCKREADMQALRQEEARAVQMNCYMQTEEHLPSFAAFEVSGTCQVLGMVVHWGYNGMLGMVRVCYVTAVETKSAIVFGTANAVKACVRLFIEGDEGNQHLYVLAEPMQPDDVDLRFIP